MTNWWSGTSKGGYPFERVFGSYTEASEYLMDHIRNDFGPMWIHRYLLEHIRDEKPMGVRWTVDDDWIEGCKCSYWIKRTTQPVTDLRRYYSAY